MVLKKLELRDFRNIGACELEFGEGVNLFCGDNAQGKTNLLEAVWLLCGQKSFRGAKDAEMIRGGAQQAVINGCFEGGERTHSCSMTLQSHQKTILHNDVREASATALCEYVHEIVFAPQHLNLVQNGPEERRAFLDGAIGATKPAFFAQVRQYEGVVFQRNALLKKMNAGTAHGQEETLDAWTQRLCLLGAKVHTARRRYTDRLAQEAPPLYGELSGGEKLEIIYRPSVEYDDGKYAQTLYAALGQTLTEDIRNGYTSLGPHREDFDLMIDGQKARGFASQGQCKSAALVLKLTEGEILAGAVGERPLILLDDVMSELDRKRQNYLLSRLNRNQILITCCESGMLRRKLNAVVYKVKGGVITPGKAPVCSSTPATEKSSATNA